MVSVCVCVCKYDKRVRESDYVRVCDRVRSNVL